MKFIEYLNFKISYYREPSRLEPDDFAADYVYCSVYVPTAKSKTVKQLDKEQNEYDLHNYLGISSFTLSPDKYNVYSEEVTKKSIMKYIDTHFDKLDAKRAETQNRNAIKRYAETHKSSKPHIAQER